MPAPRRHRFALLVLLVAGGLAASPATAPMAPSPAVVTVTSGTQFTDTAGALVQAHGGGILLVGEYYYWFGENRNDDNTFRYVSVYRSTDLHAWEFRNNVLSQSSAPELASAKIERPKVIYNTTTGQYVLWMHWENASDYGQARTAVATSSTIDGAYTYRDSFRPLGHSSRDVTVFRDDDGTAYLISATAANADLNIYRLSSDYTSVVALVQTLWAGAYREAPAMFKRDGVYFLVTSAATGWAPNQQKYASATSVSGAWSPLRNLGDRIGYGSQTAFVLPVPGVTVTSYLYLGDRWAGAWGGSVNDSEYVWLPLTFPTSTTLAMSWSPQTWIDTLAGLVRGVGSGRAYSSLVARHSGKCLDVANVSTADAAPVIQYGCNGGANQDWQLRALNPGTDAGRDAGTEAGRDAGTEAGRDAGADGGYYQLVARHSHKCLDVQGSSMADHAAVVQNACSAASTSQQWRLVSLSSGYHHLVARHSGKCLDIAGSSTADSARAVQWTCGTGTNQEWSLR